MSRPVAVVTGASAGVGRAAAVEFARAGFDVGLIARDADRLAAARKEIEGLGGRALAVPADVADAEQVEDAAEAIEKQLGAIEVWVNNAMVTIFARFEDATPAEFDRVTQVTYLGTVNGTRAALRRMKERQRGCIVQVGSALAYRSIPLQSAYCGAKAAIRGFTDAVRSELIHADSRIRISMVQLSAFNTPQFEWARSRLPRRPQPVPPIFQPEIAARAIVWVARHPRRELWVGRPAVQAILSARLVPGLGDRLASELAWEGQETPDPERPHPDNLFETVPGTFAAHGRFDEQAKTSMPQLWLAMHRLPVAIGVALLAAIVIWICLT
jgi:NAD(P)-dependent dehydrogenase (short-subunit alcohol dehydrogenase family)